MLNTKHIIITGGLGNQMFEYAFVIALRDKGYHVILDISYYDFFEMHNGYELDRVFGIDEKVINRQGLHILWLRFLNRIKPKCIYMVDALEYNPECVEKPQKYIWGYWQDERYFMKNERIIRDIFSFRGIDELNQNVALKLMSCSSISLHIRRGDYTSFGMSIMGVEYYRSAVEYIKSKIENPIFFIFSDDKDEAETMAKRLYIKYELITHNQEKNSYKDMYLMSRCKHNIIANSSFSWWGAWLNENKSKIVVAPKLWDAKHTAFCPQSIKWVFL